MKRLPQRIHPIRAFEVERDPCHQARKRTIAGAMGRRKIVHVDRGWDRSGSGFRCSSGSKIVGMGKVLLWLVRFGHGQRLGKFGLFFVAEVERADHEGVHLGAEEAEEGVFRCTDDWFAPDVEGGVDQDGASGSGIPAFQEFAE